MNQAQRASFPGRPRHLPRAIHMQRLEGLAAAFSQNSHQIDHGAGTIDRPSHRFGIADIGLDGHDLPWPAQRLEVPRQVRTPLCRPDAVAAPRQKPDGVPAHEARRAKDRY